MNILTPTADGSNTLFNESIGEYYHSTNGALQESRHVFINAGLNYIIDKQNNEAVDILEVGFGTGLNFILSFEKCDELKLSLNYTGIEAFPLSLAVIKTTGYEQYVSSAIWGNFIATYENTQQQAQDLSSHCNLQVIPTTLANFNMEKQYDLLYFDAFSVRHQPEMWTDEMIAHACSFLKTGGVFVSYAITGNLKRAIKACGLMIEKLPGAAGKREMIRGIKC